MKPRITRIEVMIAGKVLRLSPLKREMLAPALETANRLTAAKGKPVDEAWFKDMRDLLGFIFICAKPSHPDLTLSELENLVDDQEFNVTDETMCIGEIMAAGDALGVLTMEHFASGGK